LIILASALSGLAQPRLAKVFWCFFSNKNGFLPLAFAWRFDVPPTWAVTKKEAENLGSFWLRLLRIG
jgi:hypothetical protein